MNKQKLNYYSVNVKALSLGQSNQSEKQVTFSQLKNCGFRVSRYLSYTWALGQNEAKI